MKEEKKEQGFTIIELLTAIAILSIVGILIWNVFINGNEYSQTAVSKNMLQQEANVVTTYLTKIHQTSSSYQIDSSTTCQINVTFTRQDGTTSTQIFNSNDICYASSFTGTVNPNSDDVYLTIKLSDKKTPSNKLDISTILYRLKDGGL